jgi:hypothetical protein
MEITDCALRLSRSQRASLLDFESLFRERGVLSESPAALLAANPRMNHGYGGDAHCQAAQGSDPPRQARQVDGHLHGEEGSHKEEARAEKAYLSQCGGIEWPVFSPT